MRVEGVRGNGDDFFLAAIRIEGLAFGVLRLQKLVVDALRWNEHQRHIKGAFIGDDVFPTNRVGMTFQPR